MSKAEFWQSNPREIMTLLTHYGIEQGGLKTKQEVQKEQAEKFNALASLAG